VRTRADGPIRRLLASGAAAQASVPGAYAWALTVAPSAWARGASAVAKVAAVVALLALVGGAAGERRWGERARIASLWAFVLASALTWSAAPSTLGPLRVDAPRAIAGMLGWGLFALVLAAPTAHGGRAPAPEMDHDALASRNRVASGDTVYLCAGIAVAVVVQLVGWRVSSPERALLVRFVALSAGLATVGATAQIAIARHLHRSDAPRAVRLRRAATALTLLGMLAIAAALLAVRG
jgi:hypothetical protein